MEFPENRTNAFFLKELAKTARLRDQNLRGRFNQGFFSSPKSTLNDPEAPAKRQTPTIPLNGWLNIQITMARSECGWRLV
jgi:hypothetical protein